LTYSVVLRTELDFRKRDPELLTRRRRADDFNDFGLVPALSLSTSSFASKARHLLILTSDRKVLEKWSITSSLVTNYYTIADTAHSKPKDHFKSYYMLQTP